MTLPRFDSVLPPMSSPVPTAETRRADRVRELTERGFRPLDGDTLVGDDGRSAAEVLGAGEGVVLLSVHDDGTVARTRWAPPPGRLPYEGDAAYPDQGLYTRDVAGTVDDALTAHRADVEARRGAWGPPAPLDAAGVASARRRIEEARAVAAERSATGSVRPVAAVVTVAFFSALAYLSLDPGGDLVHGDGSPPVWLVGVLALATTASVGILVARGGRDALVVGAALLGVPTATFAFLALAAWGPTPAMIAGLVGSAAGLGAAFVLVRRTRLGRPPPPPRPTAAELRQRYPGLPPEAYLLDDAAPATPADDALRAAGFAPFARRVDEPWAAGRGVRLPWTVWRSDDGATLAEVRVLDDGTPFVAFLTFGDGDEVRETRTLPDPGPSEDARHGEVVHLAELERQGWWPTQLGRWVSDRPEARLRVVHVAGDVADAARVHAGRTRAWPSIPMGTPTDVVRLAGVVRERRPPPARLLAEGLKAGVAVGTLPWSLWALVELAAVSEMLWKEPTERRPTLVSERKEVVAWFGLLGLGSLWTALFSPLLPVGVVVVSTGIGWGLAVWAAERTRQRIALPVIVREP